MGAALAQILRSMAHVCEDAEWHSQCCTDASACTCDAETHRGGPESRDLEVHGGTCCWIEAHEGPNDSEMVKDLDA